MTGEELLQKLWAMTPDERACPVFSQSGYLDPVEDAQLKWVTEDWTAGSVQLRDFWPEMENPRPAPGSRVDRFAGMSHLRAARPVPEAAWAIGASKMEEAVGPGTTSSGLVQWGKDPARSLFDFFG